MSELTGAQRKALRGLAHGLDPVVHIGKSGITEGVTAAVEAALDSHELIKVRFVDQHDRKAELAEELAGTTGAEVVGRIGHVAILYRAHPEPEKRVIRV